MAWPSILSAESPTLAPRLPSRTRVHTAAASVTFWAAGRQRSCKPLSTTLAWAGRLKGSVFMHRFPTIARWLVAVIAVGSLAGGSAVLAQARGHHHRSSSVRKADARGDRSDHRGDRTDRRRDVNDRRDDAVHPPSAAEERQEAADEQNEAAEAQAEAADAQTEAADENSNSAVSDEQHQATENHNEATEDHNQADEDQNEATEDPSAAGEDRQKPGEANNAGQQGQQTERHGGHDS